MISSHLIISSRHVISSSRLISYVHPIYIAYLCRRVAVFCWLSLVSMLGRLEGVFVRFWVVFIAYLYCIFLLHIYIAYLCCRIVVFCRLSLGVDVWSFGGCLESIFGRFGGSEGCLERSFEGLEGSWTALGRSWVALGPLLACLG